MKRKLVVLLALCTAAAFAAPNSGGGRGGAGSRDRSSVGRSSGIGPALDEREEPSEIDKVPGKGGILSASGGKSESMVLGKVDFRPSMVVADPDNLGQAEFHNEIYPEVGYQFNKDTKFLVEQDLSTNLYHPLNQGKDIATLTDLTLKLKFNNVYTDGKSFSFSYEPRVLVPTTTNSLSNGMVAIVRNYFKFTRVFSDSFALTAMEIPVIGGFTQPGYKKSANFLFENRVYLVADFVMMKGKLNLSIPVMFHQTRYRDYAAAKRGGKWGFIVWTWPEIVYSVTPTVGLGVAFMSDNLVSSDLGGLTVDSAYNKGTAQLILRASL